MITVDYVFYKTEYLGRMTEADFSHSIVPARMYVEANTFGRVVDTIRADYMTLAQLAVCAVADEVNVTKQGGEIQSESNDGISVAYKTKERTDAQRMRDALALYLGHTGLLFRGVE